MKNSRIMGVIFGFLLILAVPFCVQGFTVDDYSSLEAEDAYAGDQYGFCVDTDGRWLVVGAKYADIDGVQTGAVYVYRKIGRHGKLQFVQKLVPENEDGISPAEFGESVAVSRGMILVGARSMITSNGQQSGTAYLYRFKGRQQGWVLDTEIEPFDGADGDEFGRSVALGPNRIFVGARYALNENGVTSGAVYVYKRKKRSWKLEAKLSDPNGGEMDQFGRAISFDEKRFRYLAVGSRKAADGSGDSPGKASVFVRKGRTWQLMQEIEAYDGVPGDYFGQSMKLSGNLMVVGARDTLDSNGDKVGAAYIYRLDRRSKMWQLEQKLTPPDGKSKAQYGFSVDFDSLRGTSLAVSARKSDSAAGKKTGQLYLYSYDRSEKNWILDDIVVPDELAKDDEFGQSLAMDPFSASWIAVGTDQATVDSQAEAGTVYVLRAARASRGW